MYCNCLCVRNKIIIIILIIIIIIILIIIIIIIIIILKKSNMTPMAYDPRQNSLFEF